MAEMRLRRGRRSTDNRLVISPSKEVAGLILGSANILSEDW